MSINIIEQVHRVTVQEDGSVHVASIGIQGPPGAPGEKGEPGDLDTEELEQIVDDGVSVHSIETTGVHGVGASSVASTDDVSAAQSAAQDHADSAVSDHNAATNVHGVDTTQLATQDDLANLEPLPEPGDDGDVLTLADGSPTWAAPEGGGGEVVQSGGMIGRFGLWDVIIPGWYFDSVQNATPFDGWIYYFPILIDRPLTITGTAIQIAAGDDNAVIREGLYSWLDGLPDTLIEDFGTVDASTSGTKSISLSQTIPAGRYFLAYMSNERPTVSGPSESNTVCLATTTLGRRSNWSWEAPISRGPASDPQAIIDTGFPTQAIEPTQANASHPHAAVAFRR